MFDSIDLDRSEGETERHARLRPAEELATRLDAFACAHRAVPEQQLSSHFHPWPAELVPGSIRQRRHPLEWLFAAKDDWEEVDLST